MCMSFGLKGAPATFQHDGQIGGRAAALFQRIPGRLDRVQPELKGPPETHGCSNAEAEVGGADCKAKKVPVRDATMQLSGACEGRGVQDRGSHKFKVKTRTDIMLSILQIIPFRVVSM